MRPERDKTPPLKQADLDWLIEQVGDLRDANGHPIRETTPISVLHKDPGLQVIVFDVQFPAEPFAPPRASRPNLWETAAQWSSVPPLHAR